MADGLNDARAMRVAEVMNDFRTIQHRFQQLRANPPQGQQQLTGYAVLRQCHAEAQSLLAANFNAGSAQSAGSSPETLKRQLQRILIDASARRFRVQKVYLRAVAAMRWVQGRNQILQGHQPHAGHAAALQRVENALAAVSTPRIILGHILNISVQELAAITDDRVVNELRQKDWSAGHYLAEDPSLTTLQSWIRSQH
ncbi:hypothetical protein MMC11_001908 [Xylographa trunciseda]|nr:hypothetical protein [Xylographa trunciseda]